MNSKIIFFKRSKNGSHYFRRQVEKDSRVYGEKDIDGRGNKRV